MISTRIFLKAKTDRGDTLVRYTSDCQLVLGLIGVTSTVRDKKNAVSDKYDHCKALD